MQAQQNTVIISDCLMIESLYVQTTDSPHALQWKPRGLVSQGNQNYYADKKDMAPSQDASKKSKRLVLCFDGTDNKYSADETDSNIVKIYELMDRESLDQYHYYQREFIHLYSNKIPHFC
jgi:Uncharacterized alpha/beta hydrolase domain (DUF2235)